MPAVIVMGVSGSGKSTLGRALATTLGWRFVEGDDLHPQANIDKMAAGIPLSDDDRQPFLDSVAHVIANSRGSGIVVSCSALKRVYRDRLRQLAGALTFVLPLLDRALLEARLAQRSGHFMPSSLLDSQLRTLEPPHADEDAIVIDGRAPLDSQIAAVVGRLSAEAAAQP